MDKPNETVTTAASTSTSSSVELPATSTANNNEAANQCEVDAAAFEDTASLTGQMPVKLTNTLDKDKSPGCGSSATPMKAEPKAVASSTTPAIANSNIISTSPSIATTMATRAAYLIPLRATTNISLPVGVAAATLHHTSPPHAVPLPPINLNISTTTGGNFGVTVDPQISVENLKKIIAKKLKVAKDRICLLHRDKELQDGTLKNNNLMDGSKIILIPNVETGLLAQRPENTVMQALESLNDSQVNDFLSGKTPLNLSMRLGDHMMLIQLQLSTVNPVNVGSSTTGGDSSNICNVNGGSSSRSRSSQRNNRATLAIGSNGTPAHHGNNRHHHYHHHHHHHSATSATGNVPDLACSSVSDNAQHSRTLNVSANQSPVSSGPSTSLANESNATATSKLMPKYTIPNTIKSSNLSSLLSKRDYENLQNIVKSITKVQPTGMISPNSVSTQLRTADTDSSIMTPLSHISKSKATFHSAHSEAKNTITLLEQSPIKSLSNLVSSSIKTTAIKNLSSGKSSGNSCTSAICAAACQDPITAKLTSCLCTRLNSSSLSNKTAVERSSNEDVNPCGTVSHTESMVTENVSHADIASQMVTETNLKANSERNTTDSSITAASMLHKTVNNPITRSRHRHHHHHHYHHHYHYHQQNHHQDNNGASSVSHFKPLSGTPSTAPLSTPKGSDGNEISCGSEATIATANNSTPTSHHSLQTATTTASAENNSDLNNTGIAISDTRTLAEASRNLTQTLRKLSREVFTNKIDLSDSDETPRKSNSGAVIESMKNHGKGIYSGTFSGTLNPALQDRYGRPKRDISTVIHILNDLLSATPQYSRSARIRFEAPSTSTATAVTSPKCTLVHDVRSKQKLSIKHHQHSQYCMKCLKGKKAMETHGNSNNGFISKECNDYASKITAKSNCSYCHECTAASANSAAHRRSFTVCNNTGTNTAENCVSCICRYRYNSETGERELEQICQKCNTDLENMKMKSKLDQLRLVMQQSKQKREARKLKGAPYGARVVGAATSTATTVTTATRTTNANAVGTSIAPSAHSASTPLVNSNNNAATSNEVSPNHIVEEVDTAA